MTTEEAIIAINQSTAKVAKLRQECTELQAERDAAIAALGQTDPVLAASIGHLQEQLVDIPL